MIRSLVDATLDMDVSDGHIHMFNVNHTKDLTVVISVYDTIKPANMVLEELVEWAEKNDTDLVERIERIALDMSWNAKHPL